MRTERDTEKKASGQIEQKGNMIRTKKKREGDQYVSARAIAMSFEQLANKILLDLFEYCLAVDLLRTFDSLNSRFNTLSLNHSRSYHLNLRSISKHNFETICQKYPPLLVDRTVLLPLSDNDETPMQIYSFVSRFYLDHFTRLRTIRTAVDQCHQRIHLDLTNCLFSNDDPSISDLCNAIWTLLYLVQCHIDICFERGMEAIHPTLISTSL